VSRVRRGHVPARGGLPGVSLASRVRSLRGAADRDGPGADCDRTGRRAPEFAKLQQRDGAFAVAIVALDAEDGTATLPAQVTDADPESVSLGDDVRATIRRIYTQEGVPRYGVKFKSDG